MADDSSRRRLRRDGKRALPSAVAVPRRVVALGKLRAPSPHKRKDAKLIDETMDTQVKQLAAVKEVAAIIGLAALPSFTVRILSVSHYDLSTALALLQNSPLVPFTYSSVMLAAPILSWWAGLFILAYQQQRYPIR